MGWDEIADILMHINAADHVFGSFCCSYLLSSQCKLSKIKSNDSPNPISLILCSSICDFPHLNSHQVYSSINVAIHTWIQKATSENKETINSFKVVTLKELWSSIRRTSTECVELCSDCELISKTKICNLNIHVSVQQQVLSLRGKRTQFLKQNPMHYLKKGIKRNIKKHRNEKCD